MDIEIRKANKIDEDVIKNIFYYAIYIPVGAEPISRNLIEIPELRKYYENWNNEEDLGFIANIGNENIGAIWIRLFDENNKGYGFIDDHTPELSMAVLPEYRNKGEGSKLFDSLLDAKELKKFRSISLSVDKENRALNLYQRYGFVIVKETSDSYIMKKML